MPLRRSHVLVEIPPVALESSLAQTRLERARHGELPINQATLQRSNLLIFFAATSRGDERQDHAGGPAEFGEPGPTILPLFMADRLVRTRAGAFSQDEPRDLLEDGGQILVASRKLDWRRGKGGFANSGGRERCLACWERESGPDRPLVGRS